ncbi:MAG: undecaprenyl-diphosphate phosphatase [Xanthomonadaceae bacterium]|nr:undecaprenyl-diphosphate phosphatase [Xanthomonadaceae bacterium]
MTYFEAFLYGAVQGLTEYLPVSSSAHLILLPKFLGTQDPGLSFDVFLHLGTLIATLVYFRREWMQLIQSVLRNSWAGQGNSFLNLVLVTSPAVVAGLLFRHVIENSLRTNLIQASALVVGGVALWLADRLSKNQSVGINLLNVTPLRSFSIGCFQVLALIPGMSRSGSTMMGGRALDLNRETAAKFSFLASTPITAAALIHESMKWMKSFSDPMATQMPADPITLVIGVVTSFVFGWLAIDRLLKFVGRAGFGVFAVYRVILAVVVLMTLGR